MALRRGRDVVPHRCRSSVHVTAYSGISTIATVVARGPVNTPSVAPKDLETID